MKFAIQTEHHINLISKHTRIGLQFGRSGAIFNMFRTTSWVRFAFLLLPLPFPFHCPAWPFFVYVIRLDESDLAKRLLHLLVQTQIKWKRLLKRSRTKFPCAMHCKDIQVRSNFARTQNCHVTRKISIRFCLVSYVCFPKLEYKTSKIVSTTALSCVRSDWIPYRIYKWFLSLQNLVFTLRFWDFLWYIIRVSG